eukprot:scaffold25494_cov146-Isochrysis_galbana.AAC.5
MASCTCTARFSSSTATDTPSGCEPADTSAMAPRSRWTQIATIKTRRGSYALWLRSLETQAPLSASARWLCAAAIPFANHQIARAYARRAEGSCGTEAIAARQSPKYRAVSVGATKYRSNGFMSAEVELTRMPTRARSASCAEASCAARRSPVLRAHQARDSRLCSGYGCATNGRAAAAVLAAAHSAYLRGVRERTVSQEAERLRMCGAG